MRVFRYRLSPLSSALNFTHNIGNHHPRLASKRAISEPYGFPAISLEIRGNHGKSIAVSGPLIPNPNRG